MYRTSMMPSRAEQLPVEWCSECVVNANRLTRLHVWCVVDATPHKRYHIAVNFHRVDK